MPSYATTKALIDRLFGDSWGVKPTERWGHVENFSRPVNLIGQFDITPADNTVGSIQSAVRIAAQLAASTNPFFTMTGRNAGNQPSEAGAVDAGGGLFLSTILTGVAANDSTAIRPTTAYSIFAGGPVASFQLNSSLSPEFDCVVTHATSFAANNDTNFQFQAGLRTNSGFDPTQANYDESNNCGADGAYFATNTAGLLMCVVRIGSATTSVTTTLSLVDKTRLLGIHIGANRVPTFLIDGASVWTGPALTATRQLLPTASIKTLTNAQKIVKLRGMKFSKLLS